MTHDDVVKLYASYGIKAFFDRMCLPSGYVYHNNEVALKGDSGNLPVSLHDLAHWIVATPRDRRAPNFNLGLHPSGWDSITKLSGHPGPISQLWESRASELHVLMATHYFGIAAGKNVAEYLCVEYECNPKNNELIWLMDMDMIDENYRFIPKK